MPLFGIVAKIDRWTFQWLKYILMQIKFKGGLWKKKMSRVAFD